MCQVVLKGEFIFALSTKSILFKINVNTGILEHYVNLEQSKAESLRIDLVRVSCFQYSKNFL